MPPKGNAKVYPITACQIAQDTEAVAAVFPGHKDTGGNPCRHSQRQKHLRPAVAQPENRQEKQLSVKEKQNDRPI